MAWPSATATEKEKNGIPRFALTEPSIGSTTTCVEPLPRRPASSDTTVSSSPRDSRRRRIACSAAASIAVVSSPPSPSPTTGSRSARVGSSSSTPRRSPTSARQVSSQSVKRVEEKPRCQLREEVGRLLRHDLAAARPLEHRLDRRGPDEERSLRLAAVDGSLRLLAGCGVRDADRLRPLDDFDVEPVLAEVEILAAPVEDRSGEISVRRCDLLPFDGSDPFRDAVRREDLEPLLARRDEDDHHPGARLGAVLLVEGERRLVTVMAVGDQQLVHFGRRVGAPEPVAAGR